jgi:hypothetical protein
LDLTWTGYGSTVSDQDLDFKGFKVRIQWISKGFGLFFGYWIVAMTIQRCTVKWPKKIDLNILLGSTGEKEAVVMGLQDEKKLNPFCPRLAPVFNNLFS